MPRPANPAPMIAMLGAVSFTACRRQSGKSSDRLLIADGMASTGDDRSSERRGERRSSEHADLCGSRKVAEWKGLVGHQQGDRIADAAQARGADEQAQARALRS